MTVATLAAQRVTQAPLSYRKNVVVLRGPQLAALRSAYSASMGVNDDRGWQHWAGLHGLPLPMYCQHHTPLFLPWHRAYLYYFELTLKDFEPTVTLPWWDWTSPWSHRVGFPVSYTVAEAGGKANPLTGGPINALARQQGGAGAPGHTSRNPDDPANLPTAAQISELLGLGDFLDFQTQLESIHDDVHVWSGGTMAEIPYAAYDPIFFAHHCMIDRIWRLWQLRHPTAIVPADLLNEALPPFNITVAQTVSVNALGYDYASFSSRTLIGSLLAWPSPSRSSFHPARTCPRCRAPTSRSTASITAAPATRYGSSSTIPAPARTPHSPRTRGSPGGSRCSLTAAASGTKDTVRCGDRSVRSTAARPTSWCASPAPSPSPAPSAISSGAR
jgi:tyrosinase